MSHSPFDDKAAKVSLVVVAPAPVCFGFLVQVQWKITTNDVMVFCLAPRIYSFRKENGHFQCCRRTVIHYYSKDVLFLLSFLDLIDRN